MDWGLVNRDGESVSLAGDQDSSATRSILTRLPTECHAEFLLLLQEACADGLRRRMGITQADRPLLVVDIVPLQLKEAEQRSALVVLDDSRGFDGSYDRLKNLARRNEAILRSSMDGFFVVDADCRFLEVNDAFCRMIGYTADELLRMRISDLEVDQHANGGVPSHTRTGLHHFPAAHRHKEGHLVHLEISINVLHDAGEKILVGFARDVTERKRAEEALARLTREQKLILDSAAEGIVGLDHEGNFTFVNPAAARMLGRSTGELIGRSAHAVLFDAGRDPAQCAISDCAICRVLKNGSGPRRAEGEFSRADGTQFPVEYSVTSMVDDTNAVGAVLGFVDLTERRRAEEERRNLEAQIQQVQKLESLGLLAGGIAHDLNNTLVSVQGNASLALSEAPAGSELHDRLQRVVGACERASKVIRQMLAYAGHVTCDTSPLELNRLIEDMTEFMRAGVPKTITLVMALEPELPKIEGDHGQLQQVITNLLVNAIEAIGDQTGRITISTRLRRLGEADLERTFPGQDLIPGHYACLSVEDTGPGMSTETMRRIFEPFFSQKGVGRGLGLSAMRGVVRAHRGGISVDSEPGKGTRFTMVLPTMEPPVIKNSAQRPQPRLKPGSTVLVVDDEFEVRDVVKDMLAARGLRVLTAEDGDRAIEVFRQHTDSIDVVLLDMAMPGKSGDEVLQEIAAIRPDARVIVSSGFIEENTTSRFGPAKPAAFLHKPFTTDALMERIRGVLEEREDAFSPTGARRHRGP
jgi:two-component system cell cycle sensor histidine kinase/response regulator CckA